jgi:hypothetical protein
MRTNMNREVPFEVWAQRAGIGRRLVSFRRRICGEAPLSGDHAQHRLLAPLLTQCETWRGWERGTKIPGDVVLRLIVEFNVSPEWLLLGAGPMFRDVTASPHFKTQDPKPEMDKRA